MRALAFDASLLIIVVVLALIGISRLVVRRAQRYSPERAQGAGHRRGQVGVD